MQSAPHYLSEATGSNPNGPQPGGGPPQGGGPGFQVTLFGEVITPAGRTAQGISQSYYQGTEYTPAISAGDIRSFSDEPNGTEVTYFDTTSTTTGGPDFRVLAEKLPTGDILVIAEPSNDVGATLNALERAEIIVSALALGSRDAARVVVGATWAAAPRGDGTDSRIDRRWRARRASARRERVN